MVCVKRENSVPFSFQITLPTKKIILVLSSWEQNPSIREAISEKEYGNRQNASIFRQAKHPTRRACSPSLFFTNQNDIQSWNIQHRSFLSSLSLLQLISISWQFIQLQKYQRGFKFQHLNRLSPKIDIRWWSKAFKF